MTPEEKQLELDTEAEAHAGESAEAQAQDIGEDLNVPVIAAVGLVSTITVLALIMLMVGLYYSTERHELEQKFKVVGQTTYDELLDEQSARLGSYGWVDAEAGVVSIPIDRAMQVTAAKLARDQAVFVMEAGRDARDEEAVGTGGEEEGEHQ